MADNRGPVSFGQLPPNPSDQSIPVLIRVEKSITDIYIKQLERLGEVSESLKLFNITQLGALHEIKAELLKIDNSVINTAPETPATGQATEATLLTRASEATLGSRASEATLSTLATEATLGSKASEATLATRASQATLLTRASEATLLTRATEATLSDIRTLLTPPPARKVWCASGVSMVKAASKNYLSIFNASLTQKIDIFRVAVFNENVPSVNSGVVIGYRLFRFTSIHSGGTLNSSRKFDTAQTALDSLITSRKDGVVVGGIEPDALASLSLAEMGDRDTGSSYNNLFDYRWGGNIPITLNTNEGVVIQQIATAGVGQVSAYIYFSPR